MTLQEAEKILLERHKKACEALHSYCVTAYIDASFRSDDIHLFNLRRDEEHAYDELARFSRVLKSLENTEGHSQ